MAKKQTDARPGGTPIRSGEREQNSRCRKAGANDSSSATTLVASRTAGGPDLRLRLRRLRAASPSPPSPPLGPASPLSPPPSPPLSPPPSSRHSPPSPPSLQLRAASSPGARLWRRRQRAEPLPVCLRRHKAFGRWLCCRRLWRVGRRCRRRSLRNGRIICLCSDRCLCLAPPFRRRLTARACALTGRQHQRTRRAVVGHQGGRAASPGRLAGGRVMCGRWERARTPCGRRERPGRRRGGACASLGRVEGPHDPPSP